MNSKEINYFCKLSSGVKVMTGYTTNWDLSKDYPKDVNIKAELSPTNLLSVESSPRHELSSYTTPEFENFVLSTPYTEPTKVTGKSFKVHHRKHGIKTFYLDSYNSSGTRISTSNGKVFQNDGHSEMATLYISSMSVTVPAGGFLGARIGASKPSRIYYGEAVKAYVQSGSIIVYEMRKNIKISCGTGSISIIPSSTNITISIAPRTVSATFGDADGNSLSDGIMVHAFLASDYSLDSEVKSIGQSRISGGNGDVVITVMTTKDVVLVVDLLDPLFPLDEVLMTSSITPVF